MGIPPASGLFVLTPDRGSCPARRAIRAKGATFARSLAASGGGYIHVPGVGIGRTNNDDRPSAGCCFAMFLPGRRRIGRRALRRYLADSLAGERGVAGRLVD